MFLSENYIDNRPNLNMPPIWNEASGIDYIQSTLARIDKHNQGAPVQIWFAHWQINMMMFALLHTNKEAYTGFEFRTASYATAEIDHHKMIGTIPDSCILQTIFSENLPAIKFVHLKKGMDMFPYLDTKPAYKDEKYISLALQEGKYHKVRVYKCPNIANQIVIITSMYTWTMLRKIIALLPNLYPDEYKNTPPEVLELLRIFGTATTEAQYHEWLQKYETWFKPLHLADEFFKKQMITLLNSYKTQTLKNITTKEQQMTHDISSYLDTISRMYNELRTLQTTKLGLELGPNADAEDLLEYLNRHKFITYKRIANGNTLYFGLHTPIAYYDEDMLKAYYKNDESIVAKDRFIAWLFRKIFLEYKYKMYFETNILIDFINLNYTANPGVESYSTMHQPHLHRYNCWGNNAPYIQKALKQKDFIQALEQMTAASQNLNFADSTVTRYLIEKLQACITNKYDYPKMFQDTETGKYITLSNLKELYDKEVNADETDTSKSGA